MLNRFSTAIMLNRLIKLTLMLNRFLLTIMLNYQKSPSHQVSNYYLHDRQSMIRDF